MSDGAHIAWVTAHITWVTAWDIKFHGHLQIQFYWPPKRFRKHPLFHVHPLGLYLLQKLQSTLNCTDTFSSLFFFYHSRSSEGPPYTIHTRFKNYLHDEKWCTLGKIRSLRTVDKSNSSKSESRSSGQSTSDKTPYCTGRDDVPIFIVDVLKLRQQYSTGTSVFF